MAESKPVNVLVVSKGHDYNHDSFLAMLAAMEKVNATLVEQPAAQVLLQPENLAAYDTVLFYDMSGIPGVGLLHDGANDTGVPPARYAASMEALVDRGVGMVLLNHATVGWPDWPLWRQITGSSFMLTEGELDGKRVPGSGYRGGHGPHPNPTLRLVPQGTHPVLAGLEDGFDITDEIYLKTPDYEAKVVPLLRGDFEFVAANFTPPPLAPEAEQANWDHPPGSDLIVWAHSHRASPIVVSDVGDGPAAYDNPQYRRLLENALVWVASKDARAWAASRS